MHQPAVAADAPAIAQHAKGHCLAHRLSAEQDGFECDQFGVFRQVGIERAREGAMIEEDRFLRQPMQRRARPD